MVWRVLVLAVVVFVGELARGAEPAPATRPSGTIIGKVTSEGDVPLSELVIYLESPDPARAMPPPRPAVKVSQKGAQFSPALLIISVGQTVDFPNDEDRLIEHNVFSNAPAKRFDLGLYPPGQTRSVTFDKPGAVFLYCSIHRHMDGVIFVSPTPYFSRVANDGNFKVENVPVGKWVLRTWQRRKRFAEQSVPLEVGTDKQVTANVELRRK
jgi:plastocyanin